jgi:hypothetical protein
MTRYLYLFIYIYIHYLPWSIMCFDCFVIFIFPLYFIYIKYERFHLSFTPPHRRKIFSTLANKYKIFFRTTFYNIWPTYFCYRFKLFYVSSNKICDVRFSSRCVKLLDLMTTHHIKCFIYYPFLNLHLIKRCRLNPKHLVHLLLWINRQHKYID